MSSHGIKILNDSGGVVLDSAAYPVFLLAKGAVGLGVETTISAPNGEAKVSTIVYPVNTDTMINLSNAFFPAGITTIGPWRWHPRSVGGVTTLEYPNTRYYDWQVGNFTVHWSQMISGSGGACEYDVFGNL
jgi:hypothetical protein